MEQILKDNRLNLGFERKGYVKFPLFNKKQIREIKGFYTQVATGHKIEKGRYFHTTLNTSNRELIEKVNKFLSPYFEETLPKHLCNYRLTIAGFLIKDAGRNSAVTMHQDWTFVDERHFVSFTLWVALDDTGMLNGNMQFIPGSHKFRDSLRISPDIPMYFSGLTKDAADNLVDVPSKAGECVMFNQALIHASRKNLSKRERVTCVISGYSKDAELLHFFLPPGQPLTKIERHRISVESMIAMKKDQRPPQSEFLGYVDYSPPKISQEAFEEKCRELVPPWYRYRNKIVNHFIGKSC